MKDYTFDVLSKILVPMRKKYDLVMAKKRLKQVDRYRERLIQKIKELEKENDTIIKN